MNNGRIDIAGKTNLDVFTLYDQIPTSDTTSDFREALTGTNSSYPPILRDMRGIALAV